MDFFHEDYQESTHEPFVSKMPLLFLPKMVSLSDSWCLFQEEELVKKVDRVENCEVVHERVRGLITRGRRYIACGRSFLA